MNKRNNNILNEENYLTMSYNVIRSKCYKNSAYITVKLIYIKFIYFQF